MNRVFWLLKGWTILVKCVKKMRRESKRRLIRILILAKPHCCSHTPGLLAFRDTTSNPTPSIKAGLVTATVVAFIPKLTKTESSNAIFWILAVESQKMSLSRS